MVTKKFEEDFHSPGGALTLRDSEVTEGNEEGGVHTREHESGWTITGKIHEDYFTWVNEFTATHPEFGVISGDFENEVIAESEEAFNHFWKHHEPEAWDYMEI